MFKKTRYDDSCDQRLGLLWLGCKSVMLRLTIWLSGKYPPPKNGAKKMTEMLPNCDILLIFAKYYKRDHTHYIVGCKR